MKRAGMVNEWWCMLRWLVLTSLMTLPAIANEVVDINKSETGLTIKVRVSTQKCQIDVFESSDDLKKWTKNRSIEMSAGINPIRLELPLTSTFFKIRFSNFNTKRSDLVNDMVLIPGGTLEMGDFYRIGSADELPLHSVEVSEFYIHKYEVTNREVSNILNWAIANDLVEIDGKRKIVIHKSGSRWRLFGLRLGSEDINEVRNYFMLEYDPLRNQIVPTSGYEEFPCVGVSWYGAVIYCNFMSIFHGLTPCYNENLECDWLANGYRLPTECEWEWAARGALGKNQYPWPSDGADFVKLVNRGMANFTPVGFPHPFNLKRVGHYDGGQLQAGFDISGIDYSEYDRKSGFSIKDMSNGYGLYDMAGNAREWVWDWYDSKWYYNSSASVRDCRGPNIGTFKISRGGSFDLHETRIRCAAREPQIPMTSNTSSWYNGFRIAARSR